MKKLNLIPVALIALFALSSCSETIDSDIVTTEPIDKTVEEEITEIETPINVIDTNNTDQMKLGAFSISLNVKDLATSKEFYEKFGFSDMGGSMDMNYLIMKNGNAIIGLFQGMFENNILTFNPGWDENAANVENFNDIREIQEHLISEGVETGPKIDSTTTGPASMMITDPDGNVILLDQHR